MGIIFLTTLAAGFLGVLAMCRMDQVAWKFVRLITILALAELSLAVAAHIGFAGGDINSKALTAAVLCFLAGGCAFVAMGLAPVSARCGMAIRVLCTIGSLLALAGAGAWAFEQELWPLRAPGVGGMAGALTAGAALAGAAAAFLMGSVSLAMLLGHAYLTHTEMTIQPLRRLTQLFVAGMVVRAVLAIIALLIMLHLVRAGTLPVERLREQQLVLILRYAVGLLLPAIFCYMVYRTVRLRATQSATGILYFGLVLIYLGELAALQLTRELGIPF